MKKLNKHIKEFIKTSIYDLSVIELNYYVELYGAEKMNRALKLLNYMQKKEGLVIKVLFANCSKFYSNYYNYDKEHFTKYNYVLKGGFWCDYKNIANLG